MEIFDRNSPGVSSERFERNHAWTPTRQGSALPQIRFCASG
jgi:hypothetical protein